MNLGDSDRRVRKRDKTTRKNEGNAFAKILTGKKPPENRPFGRLNATAHYKTALFKHGRVFMQIWFHHSMNQPCKDKAGDTLYDFKWQDFLSRIEISVQREHFLTHGLRPNASIFSPIATRVLMEQLVDWRIQESAPTTWWPWFISRNSTSKLASQLTRLQPTRQTIDSG